MIVGTCYSEPGALDTSLVDIPDWTEEELKEIQTQSPLAFPLSLPDERDQQRMQKSWRRHQLERYLQRWDGAYVPEVPEAFWGRSWRACDVGCGLGLFSLRESERNPEHAFLGIDKGTRRGSRMVRRFKETGRDNLFGLHGNAIPILAAMPNHSLDLLTLFYPNPWWPSKHRKKRWSYHPLISKMVDLLKPGGEILLCSNEGFYLQEWLYAMTHHPVAFSALEESYVGPVTVSLEEARSHFESKFLQGGTPCGEIRFRKKIER